MKRSELEHVLRAAGAISGVREWVIVGSQAILGARPDAPAEVLVSQEVDLFAPENESASELIDGSIGEKSPFHDTFGYYAHGVGAQTAVLPPHWRTRAISIRSEATAGVTGICPHPADLAVSKLAAGRDKDRDFVRALLHHNVTTADEIERAASELDPELASRIRSRLASARSELS